MPSDVLQVRVEQVVVVVILLGLLGFGLSCFFLGGGLAGRLEDSLKAILDLFVQQYLLYLPRNCLHCLHWLLNLLLLQPLPLFLPG